MSDLNGMLLHRKSDLQPRCGGLLAAIGLAIGIWVQNGAHADEAVAPASRQISLDDLSETRNRPVFSPSRRPPPTNMEVKVTAPPPLPPPPPPAPTPAPNLTFLGTFESATEVGAAVQIPPNDKSTIIRYGTYINGWRVINISHHRLVLAFRDRTAVFTMFNPPGTSNEEPKQAAPPAVKQFHPPPSVVQVPGPRPPR